jgi:formylglycine-generating enzyme required for sulfatase activity
MHGNVWEWVEDLLHTNYDDAPSDGSAWIEGGQEGRRVFRGGSWDIEADFLRSAIRDGIRTGFRHNNLGFRVARTLAP